jgi:pyruvate/2-oxoglutarate dehydrogenase complex dihydrolipoamide acyltransferase (E2) component
MKSYDVIGTFDVRTFPRSRTATLDTLVWGRRRHHVPIMLEIDVTAAREGIRARKAEVGEAISFTGWIIKCLGRAVSEHPHMQALRKGKREFVLFHDVDVTIVIERALPEEGTLPMPYIIRRANEKSLLEIHGEIRAAQREAVEAGEVQVGAPRAAWMTRLFTRLPRTARDLIVWRRLHRNPFLAKRAMGTVSVTALGMMGGGGMSWGIPIGIHPLVVAVGGIAQRAAIVSGQLAMREYLGLTVLFDHAVTDGAPVARFIARLQELMQAAHGLEEAWSE